MFLIVGLGNPGLGYKDTRHNIGFRVIEQLGCDMGVRLIKRRFHSRNILTTYQNKKLFLLCPETFMNLSGQSVRECADYYDLEYGKILVVHDDLDLSFGRLKVVGNGGAGGHKGVQSIIRYMGNNRFPRLKIGIGRPRHGEYIEDYVLSSFYSDEKDILENIISMAVQACKLFISEGVEPAMNKVNCQNLANKEVRS